MIRNSTIFLAGSIISRAKMKMALTLVSSNRSFGGEQKIFSHESKELKCIMRFAIYLPAECTGDVAVKVPVIYWLSGLECNETNFVQKAGAQKYASQYGFIIVCPDTSPRGCGVPGEDDSWDFGTGAGFYVDAAIAPWSTNYRMYSYVTEELPQLVEDNFPASPDERSIMGHSMGGHGALICFLRNPGRYRSVSTFAPICHPTQCPWGRKALTGYLGADSGDDGEGWDQWDATKLVAKYDGLPVDILIDQGKADEFLSAGQLQPEAFVAACKEAQVSCVLNMRDGYDHSYYYIATFIGEHFRHHARFLSASPKER